MTASIEMYEIPQCITTIFIYFSGIWKSHYSRVNRGQGRRDLLGLHNHSHRLALHLRGVTIKLLGPNAKPATGLFLYYLEKDRMFMFSG